MTYLLDVNLLLALGDEAHVHHEVARRWFSEEGSASWATCPITENGFVRIASHSNYSNPPGDLRTVLGILAQLRSAPSHVFWPDDVCILDVLEPDARITSRRTTDVYLLGLAAHNGGKLATLDRRIPAHAVRGGRDALELLVE